MNSEQQKIEELGAESKNERTDTHRLGDLIDTIGGGTPKTDTDEYWGGENLWLTPTEVSDEKNIHISDTDRKLTDTGLANTSAKTLPPGSVLMTSRATVGVPVINTEPMATNQGFIGMKIRDKNQLNNYYLLYWLKNQKSLIMNHASGSTYPEISQRSFNDLEIELPSIHRQIKIASILRVLDEKIEVNNQIAENLEEIAQSIFKSRFVDFEPYAEFKKSDIGDVPVDFSVSSLETVLTFQRGYSYSGDDLIDDESDLEPSEGHPMINLGTISPGGGYKTDGIKFSRNLPKDRYRVEPGDLVISHTDMTQDLEILGSPVLVPELAQGEMLFSHHLYKVVETDLPVEYLYYYFLSPYFKPKAENFASGTTVLSFSSKIASDVHIPIPPQSVLEQYVEKVRPIFAKKEEIRKENNRLADLRDTLLPKLMSSEIRVDDIKLDELKLDSEV